MNSRDTQIINKVLEEIAVIDNLIDGYDMTSGSLLKMICPSLKSN
jgi:hypothetical protein